MDDRYNYASPLTGHQDPVPNSDAARLRLDSPSWHLGASRVYIRMWCCELCWVQGQARSAVGRSLKCLSRRWHGYAHKLKVDGWLGLEVWC